MSTRSYVGIIEGDKVRYGYHHSSSYLEDLGIDLFENIQTKQGAYSMMGSYVDALSYEKTKEEFFRIPGESIDMEFCYGFDVEEEEWYISSLHFTDASKMYKLTEVVQNDIEMNAYKDMFVADAQDGVIRQIRKHIRVKGDGLTMEKEILVIYDGVFEDGMAFHNMSTTIDSVEKIPEEVKRLQDLGYLNISIEAGGQAYWLSDYSVEDICRYVAEDLAEEQPCTMTSDISTNRQDSTGSTRR